MWFWSLVIWELQVECLQQGPVLPSPRHHLYSPCSCLLDKRQGEEGNMFGERRYDTVTICEPIEESRCFDVVRRCLVWFLPS